LKDFAWLSGRWVGEGLGGKLEEVYSPPTGGVMLGHFLMSDERGAQFYELITLREEGGSVMLRLRHFNANLVAWEEKEKTVEFPLVAVDGNKFYFSGLTIERVDALTNVHHIMLRGPDGAPREVVTRYRRP
jgi:hypothetical protein